MSDQPALFSDLEDSALLFPPDEIRKRYTARDAGRIEGLRAAVSMLLAARWPADTIARQMHVNRRTVEAIAVQDSGKVAEFSKEYARILVGVGAEFLALARTKQHEATFKDLMIGFGIVTQRGQEVNATGESGEEREIQSGDDPGAVAAEVLRLVRGCDDSVSCHPPLISNGLRESDGIGAVGGAGGERAARVDVDDDQGAPEGGGGGSVSGGETGIAMDPDDAGLRTKGKDMR